MSSLIFLPRQLAALADCCAREEGRYAMQGVRVILDPAHLSYRLEVTDGKKLLLVKGESQAPPGAPQEPMPGIKLAPLILSGADWKKNLALGDKRTPVIGINCDGEPTAFEAPGILSHVTGLEGRFPDISQVFPRCRPESQSVRLGLEPLLAVLQTLKKLGFDGIEFVLYAPDVPVGIVGTANQSHGEWTQSGFRCDALLMPVT